MHNNGSALKANEVRVINAISRMNFIGLQVKPIANLTRISTPTISRIIDRLDRRIGLKFPIHVNYPHLGLRLLSVFLNCQRTHMDKISYFLKTPALLSLQKLYGGNGLTFLAFFAMPPYLISNLRRTLNLLRSWRWIHSFKLFICRSQERTICFDDYEFEDGWHIKWNYLEDQLKAALMDPSIAYDTTDSVPGSINMIGDQKKLDTKDLAIIEILNQNRWRSISSIVDDLPNDAKLKNMAVTMRLEHLLKLKTIKGFTDINHIHMGLPLSATMFFETRPSWVLNSLISVFQKLPSTKIYKLSMDPSGIGLLIQLHLPPGGLGHLSAIINNAVDEKDVIIPQFSLYISDPSPEYSQQWEKILPPRTYFHHKYFNDGLGAWFFEEQMFRNRLAQVTKLLEKPIATTI